MNLCEKTLTNLCIISYSTIIHDKNQNRVTITINNDLDLHFRKLASSKMLFETGWYSKAVEEAMELWIENEVFKFLFFYFFLILLAVG